MSQPHPNSPTPRREILDFIAEWFETPALLQFAGGRTVPKTGWLESGGTLDLMTRREIAPPPTSGPGIAARFRCHTGEPGAHCPDGEFQVFHFDGTEPLRSNIASWNRCRDRLSPKGLIVIEFPVGHRERAFHPSRAHLADLWHDCPNALAPMFEPSFDEWLQHRENFQRIELPMPQQGETQVVLQSGAKAIAGNDLRLCVATYGEDIGWLKRVNLDTCVYDATGSRHGLIPVPNIAREAGQYLRHIVANYGRYAGHEIFVQGMPFDHSPNLIEDIHRGIYRHHSVRAYGRLVGFDYSGRIHHDGFAIRMATELFGGVPHGLQWTPGAQFSASRQALESRSLGFWKMLLAKVEAESETSPWAIERLWLNIC